jgi:hypothetical protein
MSMAEIAKRFHLDIDTVNLHIESCLGGKPETGYAILSNRQKELITQIKSLEERLDGQPILYDEHGRPTALYKDYAAMIRELRELTVAIDKMRPSEQLVQEVASGILGPLIQRLVTVCVEEMSRTRTELTTLVGNGSYPQLDQVIKERSTAMGERFQTEMENLVPRLRTVLNSEPGRSAKAIPSRTTH